MLVANIIGGAICMLCGVMLYFGNAAKMIAGYNTMPKEEQVKYDARAMTRFAGGICFLLCAVLLVSGAVLIFYPYEWISYVSWGIFGIVIFSGLTYANAKNRFRADR